MYAMNQCPPSNNPWAAHLQPEPFKTPQTQSTYYDERPFRHHPNHDQFNGPPTYEDLFSEQYPSTPQPKTRLHDQFYQEMPAPGNAGRKQRSGSDTGSDEILQQALNFTHHASPPRTTRQRLHRPIAIPQVLPGLGQPFSRGYSPDLMEHGVSMDDFVRFIDNLNVVSAGSPPLQIVDLAGGVVGMIPIHHAQIISMGIQAVAKIGKATVSKTRGSMFVPKANDEYFYPRGLKVELVTSEALKVKLGMVSDALFATTTGIPEDLSLAERRVSSLGNLIAPVTFNVPPPDEQTNALNRMCAAQQKRTADKHERAMKKERAKRTPEGDVGERKDDKTSVKMGELETSMQKLMIDREQALDEINMSRDQKVARKPKDASKIERERWREVQKVENHFQKEMNHLEEKQEKLEKDHKKGRKASKKHGKRNDKEVKAMNKIQWILVEGL